MTLSRIPRVLMPLAVLSCLAASAFSASPASAATTRTCNQSSFSGGYFTQVRATGLSCTSARRVMVAYNSCRIKAGGKRGNCNGRTIRPRIGSRRISFRCSESRPPELQIPSQVNARVTCRRTSGTTKVRFNYQQNLD